VKPSFDIGSARLHARSVHEALPHRAPWHQRRLIAVKRGSLPGCCPLAMVAISGYRKVTVRPGSLLSLAPHAAMECCRTTRKT
jgi:hypothetical protein